MSLSCHNICPNTPGWKQIFNLMNCPWKRPMGPCNRVLWESLTVLSQIREVQFLEKINFLLFLGHKNEFSINLRGPKKVFFGLLYLILPLETWFLGSHTFNTFTIRQWFCGFLEKIGQNHTWNKEMLEVCLLTTHVFREIIRLGDKKKF